MHVLKQAACTELGRLMHDFHCKNADDMYYGVLAERVQEKEKLLFTGNIPRGVLP